VSADQQQEQYKHPKFEDNLVTSTVSNLGVLFLEQRRQRGLPIYIPSLDITINGNNHLTKPLVESGPAGNEIGA